MYYQDKLPENKHYKWQFHEARQRNADIVKSYYDKIDDSLGMHIHDFYEINIITSGHGRHYIADRSVPTDVGDVFVIPPNIPHGYRSNSDLVVYHVLLSNAFSLKYFEDLKQLKGFNMLFEIEPILRLNTDKAFYLTLNKTAFNELLDDINRIEQEATGKSHDSDLRRSFHTLSLIANLCDKMSLSSLSSSDSISHRQAISIIKSIEQIENNYQQKINYNVLANDCNMSYSTYLRIFKEMTATTPMKYQSSCRIKNAEHLLQNTDDTVLSIALTLGFYDSAHFIREFKNAKGISPAEYRKSAE